MTEGPEVSDKHVALEARSLSKDFGDIQALKDVSFKVGKGEIFGLLGSNGAGKTTALKIFLGLIRPTSGDVHVLGKPVRGNELYVKSKTGYLPETPTLYETMTGFELLDLITTLRGMDQRERRIDQMAQALELEDALEQQIGTYSKGMRQKLAFAAAVIHRPKLLLLDEPTAGLDPRFAQFFKRWIHEFGASGTTVLMCTHLTLVAEEICDRIGIISHGQLKTIGKVSNLKEHYKAATLEDVFVKVVGGSEWKKLLPSSL